MNFYVEILGKVLGEIFGADLARNFNVEFSRTDEKFGDFSTNVAMTIFALSKKAEKFSQKIAEKLGEIGAQNPRILAEKIAEKLRESSEFKKVEIAGAGFINLTISARNLAENLEKEFENAAKNGKKFGENSDGIETFRAEKSGKISRKQKIAVVEYPSPNMAKPFSVGHLRSGNQGWAAKNLLENSGWKVITDDHLGDSGSPFGFWVLGFLKFSSPEKLAKNGIYELGRIYIKIREEMKKEDENAEKMRASCEKSGKKFDEKRAKPLAMEAQNWLLKLEKKDAEAVKFSQKFNEISLNHIHEIMKRLGISTEYEYGEKFFVEKGKKAVAKLLEEKIAVKNPDNSVIIPLESQGIKTPLLVQKRNGAALYATTDLATLLWREQNWHPDLTVYSVGAEQKFYFTQIRALAKILKLHQEIFHLYFGTIDQIIDGKREKMSSRKGVVLMEELLDAAFKTAKENAKSAEISDEDLKKISVGAIKFSDFAADRKTGMLFDWETMFSLTGFSGPYVQYAAVRVNKILRDNAKFLRENSEKFNEKSQNDVKNLAENLAKNSCNLKENSRKNYDFAAEKNLILKLLEFPEILRISAQKLEPHRVANYAFELAREFNKYYEKTQVATREVAPEIREIRLNFLAKISQVFEHSLKILGIEIPEKM